MFMEQIHGGILAVYKHSLNRKGFTDHAKGISTRIMTLLTFAPKPIIFQPSHLFDFVLFATFAVKFVHSNLYTTCLYFFVPIGIFRHFYAKNRSFFPWSVFSFPNCMLNLGRG